MTLAEAIQSENMDEIIDSMNAYAISRLKSVGEKTFNGRSPLDFVGELILKIMEGDRDWEKAECPFKEFLFGCLKSDIYNFLKTLKHNHLNEFPEIPVNGISLNIDEKRKEVCELLKQEGADDDELTVFEYWMDGIFKPAYIAKDLGVDVKEIYVIIKRLERRRTKIETQAINII
jgi:DNA-directed RNA polymerase specialized sigma24 family protein